MPADSSENGCSSVGHPYKISLDPAKNTLLLCYGRKARYCFYEKREHGNNGCWLVIKLDSLSVQFHCYHPQCSRLDPMVVGFLGTGPEFNQELVRSTFEEIRDQLPDGVSLHVECRRYTSDSASLMDMLDDSRVGTVGILAPMNTGKTTLIKSFLEKTPPHFRVLVVTSRRTLAAFLSRQFASMGAVNYLELEQGQQFRDQRFIVVQLESLFRIHPPTRQDEFPRFDLVILDEVESLLGHFRSSTLSRQGKRPLAFQSLKTYITTASKVVAADGYLGSRSVKFLMSCRGSMKVYVNCLRNDPNRYTIYEDFVRFFYDIMTYFHSYAMPMVVVSSDNGVAKQIFKKLCQQYPTKRIVLINSETDDFIKSALVEPFLWKEMDACIYTATVGVGVDINLSPPHFGRIFG
jgi:hypothetical protein